MAEREKGQMKKNDGSEASIILVLNGHGYGHRMFMDAGPMHHVFSLPPSGDKGLPGSPGERRAIPMLACSRDIPPAAQSQEEATGAKTHGLTAPLKKPVTAGQPLQEFSWGRQRTLGLEAEVHHTCRRTGSPEPRGEGEGVSTATSQEADK